jgi:hypothetical protein
MLLLIRGEAMSDDSQNAGSASDSGELQTTTPAVTPLDRELLSNLFAQQNLPLAIVGGMVAAIAGGLAWAVVTVASGYQIGWMAIGIGFLVGMAVRTLGKGMTKTFGIAGGGFSLFGCALGNLLAICGLVAQSADAPLVSTTLAILSEPAAAIEFMKLSFSPMDVVFYAIAVYEGYKFSFRQISDEELEVMLQRQSTVS